MVRKMMKCSLVGTAEARQHGDLGVRHLGDLTERGVNALPWGLKDERGFLLSVAVRCALQDFVAQTRLLFSHLGLLLDRLGYTFVEPLVDFEDLPSVQVRHVLELLAHLRRTQLISLLCVLEQI